ncbi:hypothetical protein [Olleya marilimosa]|uniref:EF-hand domain-containing protein n=1 Tax=Olleya marilimosa TaxID=272164 RepID=A0ABR8LWD5_9FLAO|nr:hypothetical protein [Olleya marilimosa]MBD3862317.1 hypothetical protein [Olleya marilimosa]
MTETFDISPIDWYTIETLQKLCLREKTSVDAIKLLYQIATEENSLNDKAKIAFVDVFQVELADTILNLNDRLKVLEDIKNKDGLSELLINTYERALKGYGYLGGLHSGDFDYSQKQFRPTKENKLDYFKKVIVALKTIAFADSNFSELAKTALVFRFTDQAVYGDFDTIMEFVFEMSEKEGALSIELRRALMQLSSERYNFEGSKLDVVNKILKTYEPKSVEEELKTIVIGAPWVNIRNPEGDYTNVSANSAKSLALRYTANNNTDWLTHIELLLKGEQRQTFFFAEHLAKQQSLANIRIFSIKIIDTLSKIAPEEQNGIFLKGFVNGCNEDSFTRELIDLLLKKESTEIFSLQVFKFLNNVEYSDLLKIKTILEKGDRYLFNIEYVDFTSLKYTEFIEFINWIKDINHSFALQLLWELLRKKDAWNELRVTVNALLFHERVLEFKSSINSSLHVEDLISKSLQDDDSQTKIDFIISKILDKYSGFSIGDDSILNNLLFTLLNNYWNKSWPVIGEFLSKNTKSIYGLNSFLERMKYDNELLYNWAITNDNYYATAIKYMEVFDKDDNGDLSWNPFVKKLLESNVANPEFFKNLSSRFISYSINSNSAEQLYINRKKLIEGILDHPLKEVKEFATKMIKILDQNIEREKKEGENYEIGN